MNPGRASGLFLMTAPADFETEYNESVSKCDG